MGGAVAPAAAGAAANQLAGNRVPPMRDAQAAGRRGGGPASNV